MSAKKPSHRETHAIHRMAWLRAAVLGANDGIISTSSLLVGVASAAAVETSTVFLTGVAGLVAGAISMAAGEYISVSSQADAESADLHKEARELAADPEGELKELTKIYMDRGLNHDLAQEVARQLMQKDALEAHARDELGITEESAAKPIQAAVASALSFSMGAIIPLLAAILAPREKLILCIAAGSVVSLALLGALAAWVGQAKIPKAVLRIVFWGAFAMWFTALIGRLFGTSL